MAGKPFLSIFALIWGFQLLLGFAEGNKIIEIASTGDQRVNLTCACNSSPCTDVIWYNGDYAFYNCSLSQCIRTLRGALARVYDSYGFIGATRNSETSILSLIPFEKEDTFRCTTENVILQRYRVTVIDPNDIVPHCTVTLPSSGVNGNIGVAFVCEIYSLGLDIILTFEGIGSYIPDTPGSYINTRTKTLDLNDFNNIHNASCNAYVPGINITRSCNYPNIMKTQYTTEGNDIIVECNTESDVDWRLFDSEGREEDIQNRSWIREGGRSLLIRDVSERDVGKVVVCQPRGDIYSNGTIIFTVIPEISEDINRNHSKDMKPGHSGTDSFFVPMLLFLVLWLITTTICVVLMGCKKSQKIPTASVILDDEGIQTAPEYDTVIHNTSGRKDLDDDRSVSLGSLGGGSRRMMEEESKAHYMDMDGNHASTDYQTMKSLTYENNILSAGTSHLGSLGDIADERVTGVTHYVDMSGKNGQNDYEAMKSTTYDNL